jgi:hypothetical protein
MSRSGHQFDSGQTRFFFQKSFQNCGDFTRDRSLSVAFAVTCSFLDAMAAGVSLVLFVTTAAGVIVPWFYFGIHKSPGRPLTSTRSLLNIFLLLHSLYFLYQIIVLPPVNIFTRLKIPLNTPADAIRSILIQQSDTGDLPAPLAMLLKHLGSFDVKTYYVRCVQFTHNVFQRLKSPPGQVRPLGGLDVRLLSLLRRIRLVCAAASLAFVCLCSCCHRSKSLSSLKNPSIQGFFVDSDH